MLKNHRKTDAIRGESPGEVNLESLTSPPPYFVGVGRTGSHVARLISNSLHVTLLPHPSTCWDYMHELPHVVYHGLSIEARLPVHRASTHPTEPHPQVTGFWLMLAETRGRQMRAGILKDISSHYKSVSHQLALSPENTGDLQDFFIDLCFSPLCVFLYVCPFSLKFC